MHISKIFTGLVGHIKSGYREFCVVFILLFVLTSFLTNWVILHINSELFTGGVGDGTSGFLWLLYASKGWSYFNAHTVLINYPVGENLWSPVYITWTLLIGPLWLLSRVVTPIAAMNIMMYVGFMSSGIAGYYAIKHYTANRYISFIGGYAIAFVPYHIMKGVDHFTNIFAWVFVAIFVAFIAFWRKQSWRRGLALALSIAAACYTDGYFIFIVGVMGLALFVGGIVTDVLKRTPLREIGSKVGLLICTLLVALVVMLPIAYVQISQGKQVQSDLANARSNVAQEITYYSSKPIDFLLPVSNNITASNFSWYKDLLQKKNSRSNNGENSTYIGYSILALYGLAVYFSIRSGVRARKTKKLTVTETVLIAGVIAAPLMLMWMIQPKISIAGMTVYMPSEILVKFVPYWRVTARVFIGLQPVIVIVGCIALDKLIRSWRPRYRYGLVCLLFLVMAVEYITLEKRPSFGVNNMPHAYQWLKTQKDITAVAEVPIVDRPIEIAGYAVFAQLIHQKPLVNSALAKEQIGLLNPLGAADNNETINFLRDRGVNGVIVHARDCANYSWGTLEYKEEHAYSPDWIGKEATTLCIYKVNPDTNSPDHLYAYAKTGFMSTNFLDASGTYWLTMRSSNAVLNITDSAGRPISSRANVVISGDLGTTGSFQKKDYAWRISQRGQTVASGSTTQTNHFSATIDPRTNVEVLVTDTDGNRISEGEAGISHLEVANSNLQ